LVDIYTIAFYLKKIKVLGADVERPVGVFDSGVGGLTVLRELVAALPSERFVYVGDTARVPYGGKSAETVTRYSIEIANYLIFRHDIKLLVVACNTASSLALPSLRKIYKIPVVGMVDPCVRRAAGLSRKDRIGVIGTVGTVRSRAYEEALRLAVPSATVRSIACPLLVSLAEEGWTDTGVTRAVIAEYLVPFRADPPDALILGCTHYPVLKGAIRAYLGDNTVLIDSGEEAASVVDILLSENGARRGAGSLDVKFVVTDDPERFERVGKRFFGSDLGGVQRVTL
jgi:glutamate racemase